MNIDAAASSRPSYTVAFDVGVQEDLPADAVRPVPDKDARSSTWALGDEVKVRDGRKWASGVVSKVHANGTTDVCLQALKNDDSSRGARKLFSVPPEGLRKAGPEEEEVKKLAPRAKSGNDGGSSNLTGEALRLHELNEDRVARGAIRKILARNGWSRNFQLLVRYGDNGEAFLRGDNDDSRAGSGRQRTVVVVGNLGAGVDSKSTQKGIEQLLARHVTFKGANLDSSNCHDDEEEGDVVLPHCFAVSVEIRSGDAAVAPRVKGGLFLGSSDRRTTPLSSTQSTPPPHDPKLPAYMWDLDRGASKRNAASNADTTPSEAGPAANAVAAAPTGAESKGFSAFKSKVPRFASDPTKEAIPEPPTTLNDGAWLLTKPSSGPAPSIAPRPQHRPRRVLSRYAGKKRSPAGEESSIYAPAPSWNAGPKLGPKPSDKPSEDDGPSGALVVAQRRAMEQAAAARRGPGAYDTDAAYARAVRRRVTAATLTGRPPPLMQGMTPLQDTAPPVEELQNGAEAKTHDAEAAVPLVLDLPDAAAEPKALDQPNSSKGYKGANESDEEAKPNQSSIRPDDYSPSGELSGILMKRHSLPFDPFLFRGRTDHSRGLFFFHYSQSSKLCVCTQICIQATWLRCCSTPRALLTIYRRRTTRCHRTHRIATAQVAVLTAPLEVVEGGDSARGMSAKKSDGCGGYASGFGKIMHSQRLRKQPATMRPFRRRSKREVRRRRLPPKRYLHCQWTVRWCSGECRVFVLAGRMAIIMSATTKQQLGGATAGCSQEWHESAA